jgi:hypothetical protein
MTQAEWQRSSMRPPSLLSRRQFVLLAGSAARLGASRDDFWNTKPPSEWGAGEIYGLMNRSPWAHAVQAVVPGEASILINDFPGGHGSPKHRPPPELGSKGVVTWESAQPIRDAMKTPKSPGLENYYVIGVDGIPTEGLSVLDLRFYAMLSSTGKPTWSVRAADARELIRTTSVVYAFDFPKFEAPIGPNSKGITFEALFGKWMIRTTFKPTNMLYQGRRAL